MFTGMHLYCDDDDCRARFALRHDEGINMGRRRARADGWQWDGADYCPSSQHRTRVVPGHQPLYGTELR